MRYEWANSLANDMPIEWVDKSIDIYAAYDKVLSDVAPTGKILGVGESAKRTSTLNYPYFRSNLDKVDCVGLQPVHSECGKYEHIDIKYGNAHNMEWPSSFFDCVISFTHMEHDPEFWLSLEEMKRVLKKDGPLIVAVPGFIYSPSTFLSQASINGCVGNGTITYENHGNPDCYRFSGHWFEYVVFKKNQFHKPSVIVASQPPRLIGVGYKS